MVQMDIDVKEGKLEGIETELLAVGLFEKETPRGELKQIDKELNNEISELLKAKKFKAEFKECYKISTLGKLRAKNILLVGLGKKDKFSLDSLRKLGAAVSTIARELKLDEYTSTIQGAALQKANIFQKTQAYAEGALLGLYEFKKYKTNDEKDKKRELKKLTLLVDKRGLSKAKDGVKKAEIVSESVIYARNLVNEIPSVATPTYLANEAKKLTELGIRVDIFGKKEIKRKGFNALYAVSKGSSEEPRFIVMKYRPNTKQKIVLVGKGVTFDAGGLNLKPTSYIEEMKQDMAGAASVIATMSAAAKLKPKIGIIGIVPACENLLGSSAYKPGDILTAYNKKTIEVLNTDAEGRLVLADGLSYAAEMKPKPKAIIDLATLTGACIVCLGYHASALIGNNEAVMKKICRASEATGEKVWQLPLWEEYKEMMDSDLADVRNVSKGKGWEAGTITAAAFLEKFTDKIPWAHLDIAGTAWFSEARDYNTKGATGYAVRLLINLFENWKK